MITLTIIVFGHTHLYKYNLELNCDSLVSHHTWFFLFYALFSGKKLRKDSKTYQDLPSLLEMSILFTLADVAAVAKTWSTTGIHFLLLKPRKAKGSGDTPWYTMDVLCMYAKAFCIVYSRSFLCLLLMRLSCWYVLGVLIMCYSICWQNLDETSFFHTLQFNRVEKGRTTFFAMYSDKIALWWYCKCRLYFQWEIQGLRKSLWYFFDRRC